MNKEKLIIIGSGPAGLTAGIYASRAELKPLIFEGEHPGGQLMETTELENFPGFPDGLLGSELIDRMRKQAMKFGARTVFKKIDKVDFSDSKDLKLWAGDEEYSAESVIIATGASARWLNLNKGEGKYIGKGYTACATCDGAFFRDKVVAVVGGGDTAIEEATFLTRFASKVYLIHRRDELRASKAMQKRVFDNQKIETIWNKNVTDLKGANKLESVELTDTITNEKTTLKLDGLFMGIGHSPSTAFLNGQLELDNHGYVKTEHYTRTKIPSVFVAGDCADYRYQQAITASGLGCMAALDVEQYLAGKEE